MLFRVLRFAFRAVSVTDSFIVVILENMCWLRSSMKSELLLILLLLSKWLSFDWVFITSECYSVKVKLIRAVSSLMIRMITVEAEIIIHSMLMFLCQKLSVLTVILMILSESLRQISSTLKILQSSFSLIRALFWLIELIRLIRLIRLIMLIRLMLMMSSLILDLLIYFIEI